ncbi:MAG: ATP-dependent RNA helicase DeaD [Alteromonas naphthalenivorans]|jgi:ATP-dependent RNA helicase DeaD
MSDKKCDDSKKTFDQLGLSESTLAAIKKKGFEYPTPIQALTIPTLLEDKKDIIGQAQTGTGKTAAFGLPLIDKLSTTASGVQALILAPTRELAIQIAEEIESLTGSKKLNILPVYGGQSIVVQLQRLRKQVDIVVGTPGRVMDHIERKTLKLNDISHVILDEADEMLNMGFAQDVKSILEYTPKTKRVVLFSATMAPGILKIAQKHMGDYDLLKVAESQMTCSTVEQVYYEVSPRQRFNALCRIVDHEEPFYGLVFCRTKRDTETVARKLSEFGYHSDALNGDMSQSAREKILDRFKKRQISILVATDVAARGIDVQDVSHVVNYALPEEPEAYVHRIGRTGRAGKTGTAISFASGGDRRKLQQIERKTKGIITRKELPTPEAIIAHKKDSMLAEIQVSLEKKPQEYYVGIAQDLLKNKDAESIIALLLKRTFKNKLDPKRYTIEEERPRRDDDGGGRGNYSRSRSGSGSGSGRGRSGGRSNDRRSSGSSDRRDSGSGDRRESGSGERRGSRFGRGGGEDKKRGERSGFPKRRRSA